MENHNKKTDSAGIVFGGIPQIPTQEAIDGIRFDFNDGLRVVIPKDAKPYRIQFYDIDSESLIYETTTPQGGGCTVSSHKKYFIRFRLRILEPANKSVLFTHDFDAKDKEVTVRFPVHTLGDSIGWFSYVELHDALQFCDRAIYLEKGNIRFHGKCNEVVDAIRENNCEY